MQKIKSAALALPALLLAGCAAALPAENTATIETAAAAAPQTLKVYTSASLAPAAQAYAEAQGVALTLTDEAASADLLLTAPRAGGRLLCDEQTHCWPPLPPAPVLPRTPMPCRWAAACTATGRAPMC